MNLDDYRRCAYCPRLCRHVCPVAVATGREAATPTAMMTVPLIAAQIYETDFAIAGTSLCLNCGACTDHCKHHVPVAQHLQHWRQSQGAPIIEAEPLQKIEGDAPRIAVLSAERDWRAAWTQAHHESLAAVRTQDFLGYAAWKAGDTSILSKVKAHFAGRQLLSGSLAIRELLIAAGVHVEAIEQTTKPTFHACYLGAQPGVKQLACCGARENFPQREPEAAQAIAKYNIELQGEETIICDDQQCADWLRACGGQAKGPEEIA